MNCFRVDILLFFNSQSFASMISIILRNPVTVTALLINIQIFANNTLINSAFFSIFAR